MAWTSWSLFTCRRASRPPPRPCARAWPKNYPPTWCPRVLSRWRPCHACRRARSTAKPSRPSRWPLPPWQKAVTPQKPWPKKPCLPPSPSCSLASRCAAAWTFSMTWAAIRCWRRASRPRCAPTRALPWQRCAISTNSAASAPSPKHCNGAWRPPARRQSARSPPTAPGGAGVAVWRRHWRCRRSSR